MNKRVLFLLAVAFFGAACSSDPTAPEKTRRELISQTWVVDSSFVDGVLDPDNFGNVITLRQDSTFTAILVSGDTTAVGTWRLLDNDSRLHLATDGDSFLFQILLLNANRFAWRYSDNGKVLEDYFTARR
jgi:hypothetical protein